jgi:hypothetical protein
MMLCRAISQTARVSAVRPARCSRQTVRTMAFLTNKNEQLCGQARCEAPARAVQVAMQSLSMPCISKNCNNALPSYQ